MKLGWKSVTYWTFYGNELTSFLNFLKYWFLHMEIHFQIQYMIFGALVSNVNIWRYSCTFWLTKNILNKSDWAGPHSSPKYKFSFWSYYNPKLKYSIDQQLFLTWRTYPNLTCQMLTCPDLTCRDLTFFDLTCPELTCPDWTCTNLTCPQLPQPD